MCAGEPEAMMTSGFMLDMSEKLLLEKPELPTSDQIGTFSLPIASESGQFDFGDEIYLFGDEDDALIAGTKDAAMVSSQRLSSILLPTFPYPQLSQNRLERVMQECDYFKTKPCESMRSQCESPKYYRPRRPEEFNKRETHCITGEHNPSIIKVDDHSCSYVLYWSRMGDAVVLFHAHIVCETKECDEGDTIRYRIERVTCTSENSDYEGSSCLKTWFYDDDDDDGTEMFSQRRITHVLEGGIPTDSSKCSKCCNTPRTLYVMEGSAGKERIAKVSSFWYDDKTNDVRENMGQNEQRAHESGIRQYIKQTCMTMKCGSRSGKAYVGTFRKDYGENNVRVFTFKEPTQAHRCGDIQVIHLCVPETGQHEFSIVYNKVEPEGPLHVALLRGVMHDGYTHKMPFFTIKSFEPVPCSTKNEVRAVKEIITRPTSDDHSEKWTRIYINSDNAEECLRKISDVAMDILFASDEYSAFIRQNKKDGSYAGEIQQFLKIQNSTILQGYMSVPDFPPGVTNTESFCIAPPLCEYIENSVDGTKSRYVEQKAKVYMKRDAESADFNSKYETWISEKLKETKTDDDAEGGASGPFWYAEIDKRGNIFWFKRSKHGRALLRRRYNTAGLCVEYFVGSKKDALGERVIWLHELLPCGVTRITHFGNVVWPCKGTKQKVVRSFGMTIPVYNAGAALYKFDASMTWTADEQSIGCPLHQHLQPIPPRKSSSKPTDHHKSFHIMELWEVFSFPRQQRTEVAFTCDLFEGLISFSDKDDAEPLSWHICYKRLCKISNRRAGVQIHGHFKYCSRIDDFVVIPESVSAPKSVAGEYSKDEYARMCSQALGYATGNVHPVMSLLKSLYLFLSKTYAKTEATKYHEHENDEDQFSIRSSENEGFTCKSEHRDQRNKQSKKEKRRAKKREKIETMINETDNVSPEKEREMLKKEQVIMYAKRLAATAEGMRRIRNYCYVNKQKTLHRSLLLLRNKKLVVCRKRVSFTRLVEWCALSASSTKHTRAAQLAWCHTVMLNALSNMTRYAKHRTESSSKRMVTHSLIVMVKRQLHVMWKRMFLLKFRRWHTLSRSDKKNLATAQRSWCNTVMHHALSSMALYAKRRMRYCLKRMRAHIMDSSHVINELSSKLRIEEERTETMLWKTNELENELQVLQEDHSNALSKIQQLRGHNLTTLSTSCIRDLVCINETATASLKKELLNREMEEMRSQLQKEMQVKMEAALASSSSSPCRSPSSMSPVPQVKECVVCGEENVEKWVLLMPCKHICVCEVCVKKSLKNCPLCRADIDTHDVVFL